MPIYVGVILFVHFKDEINKRRLDPEEYPKEKLHKWLKNGLASMLDGHNLNDVTPPSVTPLRLHLTDKSPLTPPVIPPVPTLLPSPCSVQVILKVLALYERLPPKKIFEKHQDLVLPRQSAYHSYPYIFMRRSLRNDNILKWTAFKCALPSS
eukprot:1180854-Prorocentrum_minimum.AAC.1